MKGFGYLVLGLVFAILLCPMSKGQSSTTSPTTDPAVLAAQTQQALLDAQAKILQDQQSMLAGALPASSTTPNSGAYTVAGSNPFPSEKLAYEQLNSIAHTLACNLSDTTGPFVIYDQTEITNLMNYKATVSSVRLLATQVDQMDTNYNGMHDDASDLQKVDATVGTTKSFAGILLPGLVLGGLKTVSDTIGMFRTNTSINYVSFTNDDAALTAAVANALISKLAADSCSVNTPAAEVSAKSVFVPAQMPLQSGGPSTLLGSLQAVQTKLSNLQNRINLDQANLQALSDALNTYIQDDQATQANQDQIDNEIEATKKTAEKAKQSGLARVESVAQTYACSLFTVDAAHPCNTTTLDVAAANVKKAKIDHFLKQVNQVATNVTTLSTALSALQTAITGTAGAATLPAILRAENLEATINTNHASILKVTTSFLGGSYVTRQNLFTGGHLSFNGGAIVNFILFGSDGTIAKSGVLVSDSKPVSVSF